MFVVMIPLTISNAQTVLFVAGSSPPRSSRLPAKAGLAAVHETPATRFGGALTWSVMG